MLLVWQMLVQLGFNSEIFVNGGEGAFPSPVRHAGELRPRAPDLLLIHHCGRQNRLDWRAGLRCRKVLIYHGITPPRYFTQDSRDYHLAAMLKAAQLAGIDTYVTRHKTVDTVIDGRAVALNEIAEVLRGCTRLVHTEADIARLKTFGVVDNVVMIPPA